MTKLLHTRYRVRDLDRAIAFYKDVLGLEEVRRNESPRGSVLVFLKAPQSEEQIEICRYDASGPVVVGPDLTHLAFEVPDLEAFAAHGPHRCPGDLHWQLMRCRKVEGPAFSPTRSTADREAFSA